MFTLMSDPIPRFARDDVLQHHAGQNQPQTRRGSHLPLLVYKSTPSTLIRTTGDVESKLIPCGPSTADTCSGDRGVNLTEVSRGDTVLREIARNIERIESGNVNDRVCLYGTGDGTHSCVCYRDTGHAGRHQCPCGAEWR